MSYFTSGYVVSSSQRHLLTVHLLHGGNNIFGVRATEVAGLPSNLVSTTKKLPFIRLKASSGFRTALASWALAGLPTVMSCGARASLNLTDQHVRSTVPHTACSVSSSS